MQRKPTARQRYLMGFAKEPHSLWRVSDPHPTEAYGTSQLIRPYEYQNPNRGPSRTELKKLIDLGWIELRPDPGMWTENTETGERRQHYRAWLTAEGSAALVGMQESRRAYKLLRVRADGSIGPLFINARQRIPVGVRLVAEPHRTKGFAFRPGWHCCSNPVAPHLSKKGRAWFVVEIEGWAEHRRPEAQGGLWFTAEAMTVIEPLGV